MQAEEWVKLHGSGSLRRAVEEEMAWREMYYHERIAFELCSAAELILPSRIEVGVALASPDDPATTEACWYARVLRWRFGQSPMHRGLTITVRHLRAAGEPSRAGIGLVFDGFDQRTWSWLPAKRFAVAFVETNGLVSNPC